MFEKRFLIFKATETFLNQTISDRHVSTENLIQFDKDTQTASYLFDEDIVNFLEDIRRKGNLVTHYHKQKDEWKAGHDNRMEIGREKFTILEEFINKNHTLKDKFSPYLKFRKWNWGMILPFK